MHHTRVPPPDTKERPMVPPERSRNSPHPVRPCNASLTPPSWMLLEACQRRPVCAGHLLHPSAGNERSVQEAMHLRACGASEKYERSVRKERSVEEASKEGLLKPRKRAYLHGSLFHDE